MSVYSLRIEQLKQAALEINSLDEYELAVETLHHLDLLGSFLETSASAGFKREINAHIERHLGTFVSAIANAKDPGALAAWMRGANVGTYELLGEMTAGNKDELDERDTDLLRFRAQVAETLQKIAIESDRRQLREALEASRAAVERAESAADAAEGALGERDLAVHFSEYSGAELRQANLFRWLSVGGVVAVILVAAFVHPDPGDVVSLIYRLALLTGIGALAAYFARQAGQHRRVFNWAKGLEVQLRSFSNFVQPAPPEAQADIYREFARRALGAPPDGKPGSSDEATLPASQLIDLATTFAKRQ